MSSRRWLIRVTYPSGSSSSLNQPLSNSVFVGGGEERRGGEEERRERRERKEKGDRIGGVGKERRRGGEERGLKISNFETAQCVKASCKDFYNTLSHSKCPHTHTVKLFN